MICRSCSNEIDRESAFCPFCGAPVQNEPERETGHCSQCGAELPEGAVFCASCGQSVQSSPVKRNEGDLTFTKKSRKAVAFALAAVVCVIAIIVLISTKNNRAKDLPATEAPYEAAEEPLEAPAEEPMEDPAEQSTTNRDAESALEPAEMPDDGNEYSADYPSIQETVVTDSNQHDPTILRTYELMKQYDYIVGDFSENRAWVQYKNENNEVFYGVIDENGYLKFSIASNEFLEYLGCDSDSSFSNSVFCDGVSCFFPSYQYIFSRAGFAIVDADGNVLFKPTNTDEVKYFYLGYGDGQFLIGKTVKSFSEDAAYIYTIDRYGNEIIPPEEVEVDTITEPSACKRLYAYLGNGLFVTYRYHYLVDIANGNCHVENYEIDAYSFSNQPTGALITYPILKSWCSGQRAACISSTYYRNGATLNVSDDVIVNLNTLFDRIDIEEIGVYNNGFLPLKVRGADRNTYIALVDNSAELVYEPIRVNSVYVDASFNGFVPVEDADYHLKIVSPTGTMMSVGDSITGLGEEAVFIITSGNFCQNTLLSGGFFNGCMMTLYDSDGSTFGNVYVSVSGDRTIRNVFFTDQTKTTNDAMLENLDQAELVNTDNNKTYIHPSSFNIEGKWKNNGEYTFGQVQAESIISFDGEHCNVYSPQDTYAFYKDGDDFRLSCTSFLFSDTVSFTVKIVDEYNIDLVDGSDILELTRVE